MKTIPFTKYQGTGNDFIMIDNRDGTFDRHDLILVRKMCDRHFGIGADGLILVGRSGNADFEMVYFNSDGSMSFCGNGSRCSVAFANEIGMIGQNCSFEAIDGIHKGIIQENKIGVSVKDVNVSEAGPSHYFIFTGSPHYIVYVNELDQYPVVERARAIRYSERFKDAGTNVNFVEVNGDSISVRTYERGVEDETLSCGSGVTACAISFAIRAGYDNGCKVNTRGGELSVSFQRDDIHFRNIFLYGPAAKVFKGEWYE